VARIDDLGVRVLIIDESSAVRERLEARLREAGVEVVAHADTAVSALACVHAHQLDAIVIEILFRDRRGLDLVPALRAAAPRALLVIVTNAPHYRRRCLELGADVVLDKSSQFDDVPAALSSLAGTR